MQVHSGRDGHHTPGVRPFAAQLLCSLLAAAVWSGCGARYVRIAQDGLTCAEAQQIAIDAVRRLGYTIGTATKPTPGSPGLVTASRQEGTTTHGLMVQIFCTTLGAEVEAKTEEGGLAELNFPSEFRRSFTAAAAVRPPPRAAAASGLDVLVTPERTNGADLGVDLSNTGVLPVSVRISNRTERVYRFRVKGIVLQTAAGEQVAALKAEDMRPQMGAASTESLRQKLLSDRDVQPNETLTGFLLFPFNSYARARIELIDRASDEPEGFAIEF